MTDPRKVSLADATPAQLRHFAAVHLGLEVSPHNSASQLIAKINAANPEINEIVVEDAPAPQTLAAIPAAPTTPTPAPPPTAAKGKLSTRYHDDPKVTIFIGSSKEPGGNREVQVAVNGDAFLIKRDVEVDVPYRVYEALNMAREQDVSQTPARPGAPAEIVIREVHSYPFSVTKMPPRDEIEAYYARTNAVEFP